MRNDHQAQSACQPEQAGQSDALRQRTPADYAIEHAGYLVTAANQLLETRNEHDELVMRQGEDGDVDDDAMQTAQEAVCDASHGLRAAIHECEKRRDRALAARQTVGEPVAWMTHHDEPMLFPTAAEAAAYCVDDEQPVPLFRSPAQAVDLGQFREAVAEWRSNWANYGRTMTSAGRDTSKARRNVDEADRLLALIDSQAVGNG